MTRLATVALGVFLATAAIAPGASALTISPLNGTPDASPHTQISFLGMPSREIHDI
jgi:hypothetical protein